MDFLLGLLPDNVLGYVNLVSLVVTSAAVIAAALAKLTPNKTDDKVADFLKGLHDKLALLVPGVPPLDQKRVGKAVAALGAQVVVRDHRTVK